MKINLLNREKSKLTVFAFSFLFLALLLIFYLVKDLFHIYSIVILFIFFSTSLFYLILDKESFILDYKLSTSDYTLVLFCLSFCLLIRILFLNFKSLLNNEGYLLIIFFGKLFVIILGSPIVEELFFRGTIQDLIEKKFSPLLAILVASVLFSLSHYHKIESNIYLIYFFLISIPISFSYYKSKNLVIPIIIHIALNFLILIYSSSL